MGYIGDLPKVSPLLLYAVVTSLAGVATLVVPLLKTYVGLAIYCGVYGFMSSANYALTTIILVELLGMDRLSDAFGITSMAEGLATLVGLPFAGHYTFSDESFKWMYTKIILF